MSRRIFPLILLLVSVLTCGAEGTLTFSGLTESPVMVTPPASTGLKSVIVLPGTSGVSATYTPSTPGASVEWQRFSALGGGYAEPMASDGGTVTLEPGDMGYIVTEGNSMTCYWVVDYSLHPLQIESLSPNPDESDCATTCLSVGGSGGEAIRFYSINGAPQTLSRDLELTYRTLEFSEADFAYKEATRTDVLPGASTTIFVDAPLCTTDFTLVGDRFLKAWGHEIELTTPEVEPLAVEASTRATQQTRQVDNEQKVDANLGGSGPCEITFESALTDAAVYRNWELARDSEFNLVTLQFPDADFTYTFREQGTTYVRLVCANAAGTCEFISETYEVFIGESDLKCPNAFSPGSSPGVNDEWRVSYKSIISFDCHIFNRWGQQMAHLTDPSQGWDGKSGGKVVPAGVYFYVITAKGTDGKHYKLSGDINVVHRQQPSSNSSITE